MNIYEILVCIAALIVLMSSLCFGLLLFFTFNKVLGFLIMSFSAIGFFIALKELFE